MDRRITRRDFLDGVAIGVGSLFLAACTSGSDARTAGSSPSVRAPRLSAYPPGLTGMRGSTDAAMSIPHMLRDGAFWNAAGGAHPTGETYDLVVVGGGISGLASAYFYSRRNRSARILILDNHDDFGGHARRNEFTGVAGRRGGLLIGYGGTESIEAPDTYSRPAMSLLENIGIEVERFREYYDGSFWQPNSLSFFDAGTWGRDHVAIKGHGQTVAEYLKDAPMADEAKRDLAMLYENPRDWMPGLSEEQKKERLSQMTYAQYLSDVAKVHSDAVKYLQNHGANEWGYGIDGQGAIDIWRWAPGFRGLGLDASKPSKYNSPSTIKHWHDQEPYIFHFPEGNAGITRLLVRWLIPEALPGHTMEDEVLAPLAYDKLDLPGNRVRIRLGSPVVRVKNVGDPATEVEVAYVQGSQLKTVRAKGAIMACWYSMVPYIVDGFPEVQKKAARFMGRIPLVYGTVQLRTRRAFEKMAVWGGRTVGPGAQWIDLFLDYPVSMGGYRYPMDLHKPGLLHLTATPTRPGMSPREGAMIGRQDLYQKSFADFERSIRELTARSLADGGFDPARDIQAITINRWAHGYSIEYTMPWDKDFYPDGPLPGEVAAWSFGGISFANTDRSSVAYSDAAIDAAYSAVDEQFRGL
jgi:spermidine dehydrogenase